MTDDGIRAQLQAICGARGLLDEAALEGRDGGFHDDNLGAGLVVLPPTTQATAEVVRLCRAHGLAIVPHGGLTGLAGGAASSPGEVIVSTARLKGDIVIDAAAGTAEVSAGTTLEDLETAANGHGLSAGIDIAARGTATIGGMIATNAGGSEAFRNGIMRQRVLGLEAVTGSGDIVRDLKQVAKANEGLDVKQLFIGSEGTLGIITGAVVKLEPMVIPEVTLIVSCTGAVQGLGLFNAFRSAPACHLLKAEIMWRRYAAVTAGELGLEAVLPDAAAGVQVIFEAASRGDGADDLLNSMAGVLEAHGCQDVIMAQNERERANIWLIREDTWAVERRFPGGLWYDVSVPLAGLDAYVARLEGALAVLDPAIMPFVMGHLGDGNLHLTIARDPAPDTLYEAIADIVYDGLAAAGGSFSAEHGIGLEKKAALAAHGDPGKLAVMHAVKRALDPDGIMNPGKVM